MDDVSMPSRTHGELMKTMKMAGRPSTTQMEGAHGGGTNTQKIGSLSQNLGTGWQQPIPGTIKLSGSTMMDATSLPRLNPGSSMNKAMTLTNSFKLNRVLHADPAELHPQADGATQKLPLDAAV